MRMWHYLLLPYLPNSQLWLLSQKRECDKIWNDIKKDKKTNHILINYIWKYRTYKFQLATYYYLLQLEFKKRGYKFVDNYGLDDHEFYGSKPFYQHHNNRYLLQCFFNLQEKYDRGQKNFSEMEYFRLKEFVEKEIRSGSIYE